MHITVITSSYPRFVGDSVAPFVKSLSEAIADRGHDVIVIAPYDAIAVPDTSKKIIVKRFKYIFLDKFHIMGHSRSLKDDAKLKPFVYFLLPLYIFFGSLCLYKNVKRQKSDVIHAHWVLPGGLIAALVGLITKTPFIISLHGSDIYVANRNIAFKWVTGWIFRRAKYVSACSQELFDRAESLGAKGKVKLIAWGADPNRFKPLDNKSEVRKQYGWKNNELVICSLGRMVSKKGFNRLIAAFAALRDNKKLRLVIGGEGPLKNDLIAQTFQLGLKNQVEFPGNISWCDVGNFFGAADLFVLPSVRDKSGNIDGLPTVLLEAMACGLACVASNIGGVSLVIKNYENGVIFDTKNDNELKSILEDLLFDREKREELGNNARRSVVDHYNWSNVSNQFDQIIKTG